MIRKEILLGSFLICGCFTTNNVPNNSLDCKELGKCSETVLDSGNSNWINGVSGFRLKFKYAFEYTVYIYNETNILINTDTGSVSKYYLNQLQVDNDSDYEIGIFLKPYDKNGNELPTGCYREKIIANLIDTTDLKTGEYPGGNGTASIEIKNGYISTTDYKKCQ